MFTSHDHLANGRTVPQDGLGLHLWTLDDAHLTPYFRVCSVLCRGVSFTNIRQHIYSTNVAYCASATFIKLAILFQYLRLFAESATSTSSSQYRVVRRIIFFLITLSSLWGLTFFLLSIFPCQPIYKNWHPYVDGKCFGWGSKNPADFFVMFAAHTASNMFLDILVLLTPIPFLGMLRLAGKSKAGLITLFTLGCM